MQRLHFPYDINLKTRPGVRDYSTQRLQVHARLVNETSSST